MQRKWANHNKGTTNNVEWKEKKCSSYSAFVFRRKTLTTTHNTVRQFLGWITTWNSLRIKPRKISSFDQIKMFEKIYYKQVFRNFIRRYFPYLQNGSDFFLTKSKWLNLMQFCLIWPCLSYSWRIVNVVSTQKLLNSVTNTTAWKAHDRHTCIESSLCFKDHSLVFRCVYNLFACRFESAVIQHNFIETS